MKKKLLGISLFLLFLIGGLFSACNEKQEGEFDNISGLTQPISYEEVMGNSVPVKETEGISKSIQYNVIVPEISGEGSVKCNDTQR